MERAMSTTDGQSEAVASSGPGEPPEAEPAKKKFEFPSAITILVLVLIVMWVLTIFIPSGRYQVDADGGLIAGSYEQIDSPLDFGEQVVQLIRSPINGTYGIQGADGFVDTENTGFLFGSVGVVVFIFSLGIFISVSFATRSLEVAVAGLAERLRTRGWLLIVVIMVLFSLLGSTMGFSVETFGFYALFLPLMAALGYDRMTTSAMIILGATTGAMASTVNPFSIGVASGEAGVSIGDGIGLRLVLWVVLTALSTFWVVRYAQRVRAEPSRSIVADDPVDDPDEVDDAVEHELDGSADGPLTGTQKVVLLITGLTFGLLIFSVIPWSSILNSTAGGAEYDNLHETVAEPFAWELGWWFPQLSMLFVLSAVLIGFVARMGEKKLVKLMVQGVGDMVGPAIVIVLARGVAVLLNNTETLDTVLNTMENLVDGTSSGVFALLVALVNMPLAFLIPSSSGHATLAMPLVAPLADFAGVSRPLTITAFQMGHGLMLLIAPTNVVIVGGLAIAKVGYNRYLRFVLPLFGMMAVVISIVLFVAAYLD
jgi:uncharacterized ion transporter superfamily protein YfcC